MDWSPPGNGSADRMHRPAERLNIEADGVAQAYALLCAIREGELLADLPAGAGAQVRHELGVTLLDMAVDMLADVTRVRRATLQS